MRNVLSVAVSVATVAVTLSAAACGGGGAQPSATASPAVDPCLVGRWTSTGVSGTIVVGTTSVNLSSSGGEVLTITSAGDIVTDESHAEALTGTTPDGTAYRLVQSGRGTGTITSTANRIGVSLRDPAAVTISLYRNGTLLQSTHPGAASDTYTCRAHSALVIVGARGTLTTYTPG